VHFYAREFKESEHINFYIEFFPDTGSCEKKQVLFIYNNTLYSV